MTPADREELLNRMISNVKRTIRKLKQLIRESESFNDNRTDCIPLDVGRDKAIVTMLKRHLAELESPRRKKTSRHLDRVIELLNDAEQ